MPHDALLYFISPHRRVERVNLVREVSATNTRRELFSTILKIEDEVANEPSAFLFATFKAIALLSDFHVEANRFRTLKS